MAACLRRGTKLYQSLRGSTIRIQGLMCFATILAETLLEQQGSDRSHEDEMAQTLA